MQSESINIRLKMVGKPEIIQQPIINTKATKELKVNYNVQVIVNRPKSEIEVIVSLSYLIGKDSSFSGKLSCIFDVLNLESFITSKNNSDAFIISSNFLPMLINIAFSTTRGYFVSEFKNTALAKYPFPLVETEKLLSKTSYQLI